MKNKELLSTLDAIFEDKNSLKKGILAIDERPSSLEKKFLKFNVEYSKDRADEYRELLLSTVGIERFISGVILAEDTFESHKINGKATRVFLKERAICVGVKVDDGLEQYEDTDLFITKGLSTLEEKCKRIKDMGADFVKWRGTIPVRDLDETYLSKIGENFAEYARIAVSNNLVPIIEPEILIAGNHTSEESSKTLKSVLDSILNALSKKSVSASNCILKTSFVLTGTDSKIDSDKDAAENTLKTFKNAGLDGKNGFYGIVFLSGGLSTENAINYLQKIKHIAKEKEFNVPLTFSYGRALQDSAFLEWGGDKNNKTNAQLKFSGTIQNTSRNTIDE